MSLFNGPKEARRKQKVRGEESVKEVGLMTVVNREAGARIHGLWNAAKDFEKA